MHLTWKLFFFILSGCCEYGYYVSVDDKDIEDWIVYENRSKCENACPEDVLGYICLLTTLSSMFFPYTTVFNQGWIEIAWPHLKNTITNMIILHPMKIMLFYCLNGAVPGLEKMPSIGNAK